MINESEIQQELRDLIKENPTLPLKIFVSDDANSGEYTNEESYISSVSIDELTLLEKRCVAKWLDREDYLNELIQDLEEVCQNKELIDLKIKEEMAKVKFEKFIVINIG